VITVAASRFVRGRNGHYWPSPAQIRTSPIKASGSYREYLAGSRVSLRLAARGPAPVTRFPGSVPGTCFAGSRSSRSPPFAPPVPPPVARLCSLTSLLLWRSQTSRVRASSASAPRLPDADQHIFFRWPNPRSPDSHTKSVRTCQGLRPRRVGRTLAMTRPSISPSVILTTSAPDPVYREGVPPNIREMTGPMLHRGRDRPNARDSLVRYPLGRFLDIESFSSLSHITHGYALSCAHQITHFV
jgi:hypothetical protein